MTLELSNKRRAVQHALLFIEATFFVRSCLGLPLRDVTGCIGEDQVYLAVNLGRVIAACPTMFMVFTAVTSELPPSVCKRVLSCLQAADCRCLPTRIRNVAAQALYLRSLRCLLSALSLPPIASMSDSTAECCRALPKYCPTTSTPWWRGSRLSLNHDEILWQIRCLSHRTHGRHSRHRYQAVGQSHQHFRNQKHVQALFVLNWLAMTGCARGPAAHVPAAHAQLKGLTNGTHPRACPKN